MINSWRIHNSDLQFYSAILIRGGLPSIEPYVYCSNMSAPEILLGITSDFGTDIWSLGCLVCCVFSFQIEWSDWAWHTTFLDLGLRAHNRVPTIWIPQRWIRPSPTAYAGNGRGEFQHIVHPPMAAIQPIHWSNKYALAFWSTGLVPPYNLTGNFYNSKCSLYRGWRSSKYRRQIGFP